MFSFFWNQHHLERSPLSLSVPLDGTDTVMGLRTIERLQAANLLQSRAQDNTVARHHHPSDTPTAARRRRYRRYKGPFIEYLALEDFTKSPRPWDQFFSFSSPSSPPPNPPQPPNASMSRFLLDNTSYTIPASMDLLYERIDVRSYYHHLSQPPHPPAPTLELPMLRRKIWCFMLPTTSDSCFSC